MTTTTLAPRIYDAAALIASMPLDVQEYLAEIHVPGAFQKATIVSEIKPRAASKHHELVKVTEAIVRTGVAYENMSINQDTETGELPWGEWTVFPYLIQHKGQWYFRLYVKGDSPMTVTYFVDGAKVTKDEFNSHLTPSAAKPKKNSTGTITVKSSGVTLG